MKDKENQQQKKESGHIRGFLLGLCLAIGIGVLVVYATESTSSADDRKLQNGSFEEGQTFPGNYSQPDQSAVPSWNTTAFQGKIELFKKNTGTYIAGVTLEPKDGTYAAELNADEESTLYQNVKTTPSSVYEWGLDHGARNGTDTMALVIGPKQSVDPSKPSKDGRDQFMQMVDWLKKQVTEGLSVQGSTGEDKRYTVYSKKFATGGAFEDNAGDNAFSLTPSTIYTEKWDIWIIKDERTTSKNAAGEDQLVWGSYGSNAEGSAGSDNGSGSTTVDLSKYYLYTVPAGQTETVFGFVSVGYTDSPVLGDKAKTYGNFLDNINFQLYHPLSGSTSSHGSAVIGGSDGTAEGEGSKEGHEVTIDNNLTTYIKDGEPLKIQAIVKKDDADDGCEFVGVYYTKLNDNGDVERIFLQLAGNEITDTGSLTDQEKEGKWIKSTNTKGDIIYTYYLEGLTSPTDLHFVFIKSPTVTYDPNGGKEYVVERTFNTDEEKNVYSFKPASGVPDTDAGTSSTFIKPYVSKKAEGQNDGWKFMGWLLTGDTVTGIPSDIKQVNADGLGKLLLSANHTIACDYSLDGVKIGEETSTATQYFKIYNESTDLTKNVSRNDQNEVTGVSWTNNDKQIAYANVHKGLTLVAQWRWLQAFIPQVGSGNTFTDSENGGTVEITSVTDKTDKNYNDKYVPNEGETYNGGKSYHAETDETITAKATAKEGYTFEGWYDATGNLITTNTEYSYVETKESVNTYYARFSNSVTQTYIRQVKNGDTWEDTTNDSIGTLGRYEYIDAPGMPISSTAKEGTDYKFVGWYDTDGNKVTDEATLSYTTKGNATYYARFETAYTVKFVAQTKQANGTFKTDTVGGNVSVASVKGVDGTAASSKATANAKYKFLGWYDKNGNQLELNATYSTTTTPSTNNVTYYARFEQVYEIENQIYLSFVAESDRVTIPSAFDGRNAGTGKNAKEYGLDNKYGNTIATGFKYSIMDMTNVSTIQINISVPKTAYVKVGGTGNFTGKGTAILTDSSGVKYNKGSILQISGATTLTYHWDASGLQANTKYGFIIDNLYAPGATATITVNGTGGTKVTESNGVVNTASGDYKKKSHYSK